MSRDIGHQENIGPYRLLSRLEGGPGVAYRAAGESGDVAIRTLPAGAARPGARLDVERMKQVLSPYVVDVLDGSPDADPPYVVSRLVPGRPLSEHLAEHGALRGAALRALAIGLAKGLAAIHRVGLTHGALSPGTVRMVDGAPVIVDFGVEPGDGADDVHAWAATVTFAATSDGGAPPEPLVPLLRAATAPDPGGRPSAAELAAAVAELDLGPAPVPAPRPVPAEAVPPPEKAGDAGEADESDENDAWTDEERAHELAVAQGWSRLLSVLVVVIAAGVSIMIPVVGPLLSIGAVALLRVAGETSVRGRLLALGRTAVTLPYAAFFTAAVPLALAALSLLRLQVDALSACAFGAGTGTVVLWAAPGVRGPRRQLERAFMAVADVPRWIAAAGIGLGLLAFLAIVGAMSLTPSFSPLYGLQSTLANALIRLQSALH
ncbi:hypothetical protein [Actinomadura hibisca]|uniref:hypothetical protein n=1 Tax=Actinomadura hibisca TaxID=68565 RepID=UPI0008323DCC|nr:hypothetical protein [Actinomadura hibisca]